MAASADRRFALAEILVIFLLFALQGAWPAPEVNETHYLSKAAHYWNPEWIPGDFFLDSADSHKVFYFTFGWLTLWLPLPAVAWTGRIVTWLLMAWAWRRLSHALIPRFGGAILTAGLFVMLNERFQMAGEWFIGGVEAKGFAYILLLLGLEALVENRWNRAWLLFGAAAGFHALVGGWAVVATAMAWLFMGKRNTFASTGKETERPKLLSMLPGLIGGLLLSLPGLIPALMLSRNLDAETIRHANVIYVFERLRHHLDLFQIRKDFIAWFAGLTFVYIAFGRMTERIAAKSSGQDTLQLPDERWRILRLQSFVAGSLAIAMIGILIDLSSLFDRTFAAGLLRFYWFRLADIAVPLGTSFLIVFWICKKLESKSRVGKMVLGLAIALACIHFGSYIPARMPPTASRADRLENVAAWQDACRWIADNTPPDARFFTPRLSQTFKWYARRAEVATWKDVPQDAAAIVAWWNRIQDVFATGSPQPEFRWRENVTEMKSEELQKLAKKYQARYILAPAGDAPPNWETIYRNQGYDVYRFKSE